MKKILFFLLTLCLCTGLNVSANNVLQRTEQNFTSSISSLQKNRMVLPRHANKKVKDTAEFSHTNTRPLSVVKPAMRTNSAINNAIVCTSYSAENYGTDIYIEMYDANEEYKVCVDIYATELEDNRVYTLEEMDASSTFVRYIPTYDTYTPSAVTYEQWTDEDGSFHVAISMTTNIYSSYEDIIWEITYDEVQGDVGQTYELEFQPSEVDLIDYTEVDSSFQFSGKNENAELYITISSDVIEGDYVWSDFMELYTGIYLYDEEGNKTLVTFSDATATVTVNPDYANSYTCDFRGVSVDGSVYTSVLQYIPSEIEYDETIDIVATNMSILDFSGIVIISASNDKYGVSLSINTDNVEGPWTMAEVDGFWSSVIEYDEDGMPTYGHEVKDAYLEYAVVDATQRVTGWLVCDNRVKYQLDLSYTKPSYTRDETIEIMDALIKDNTLESGYFSFGGTTDDNTRYVYITIYNNSIEGEYETDDFDEYVTYVDVRDASGVSIDEYSFIEGTASVVNNNGTYTLSGTIVMQSSSDQTDVPRINLTMTGKIQTGMDYDHDSEDFVETLTHIEQLKVDSSSTYGYYVSLVATDDKDAPTKEIYLLFMVSEEDADIVIPEGEYTISETYETGTVVACPGVSSGSVTPSFAGNIVEGGIEVPLWFLREGTVVVTNDNGNLLVTVDAKNSYGRTIDVVIKDEDSGIDQVRTENNVTGRTIKYIKDNQIIIERDGVKYNVLGIRIE